MDLCELSSVVSRTFRKQDDVNGVIRAAAIANADIASCREIGRSEEERPLLGITLGTGDLKVSLLAGAHADEPVGPETLRTLVLELLHRREDFADLLSTYTFSVVTHINPDGEIRNRKWTREWPNVESYIQYAVRELPGKDIEFGYPNLRKENSAVSQFLSENGPFDLHMSLHGMGFAEGVLLLVDRHWAGRTQDLRRSYVKQVRAKSLGLHDHNRKGEKGFFYIEEGFATTPEGAAMQAHFRHLGDDKTAARFRKSSMEFVRSLGGDPLCMVTEVPLYSVRSSEADGTPTNYNAIRESLPEWKRMVANGESIRSHLHAYDVHPVHIEDAAYLQLTALELGLKAIRA